MNQSRGMRNRNPLNIRRSADRWKGSTRVQEDPEFVTFSHIKYGYRAAWLILRTYHRRLTRQFKDFDLWNIISQWAPEADGNDPRAYVKTVRSIAGIGGKERFCPPDTESGYRRLTKVLMAMTCVECGMKPGEVNLQDIRDGYKLAFPYLDFSDEELDIDDKVVYIQLDE